MMNDTNVPKNAQVLSSETVLAQLQEAAPDLSPQVRKAAAHILDNPTTVGVSSIREIADAAGVKPNTLVRMARAVGFDGFETFREPFREAVRSGGDSFQDRARWLQALAKGGRLDRLYASMAETMIGNVEQVFAAASSQQMKQAADMIVDARMAFILGVGVFNPLAQNFAYLASMGFDKIEAIPGIASAPIDGLAKAMEGDVLLAMSVAPYRTEVVETVRSARDIGMKIIVLTDSHSSPLAGLADHLFVVQTETPQFFTSTVSVAALLETLMTFVIADADDRVVNGIERFHERRRNLGAYWDEDGT